METATAGRAKEVADVNGTQDWASPGRRPCQRGEKVVTRDTVQGREGEKYHGFCPSPHSVSSLQSSSSFYLANQALIKAEGKEPDTCSSLKQQMAAGEG